MKTFLKSIVAASALVAPLAGTVDNASAVKLPKVFIPSCQKTHDQIPAAVSLNCTTKYDFIGNLVWKTWTLTSATASGTLNYKTTLTRGTYTFSGVETRKGVMYYTTVTGPGLKGSTLLAYRS